MFSEKWNLSHQIINSGYTLHVKSIVLLLFCNTVPCQQVVFCLSHGC